MYFLKVIGSIVVLAIFAVLAVVLWPVTLLCLGIAFAKWIFFDRPRKKKEKEEELAALKYMGELCLADRAVVSRLAQKAEAFADAAASWHSDSKDGSYRPAGRTGHSAEKEEKARMLLNEACDIGAAFNVSVRLIWKESIEESLAPGSPYGRETFEEMVRRKVRDEISCSSAFFTIRAAPTCRWNNLGNPKYLVWKYNVREGASKKEIMREAENVRNTRLGTGN